MAEDLPTAEHADDGAQQTSPAQSAKPRLLVFIVAYNAEKTIRSVLVRIPPDLVEHFDLEALVIDDASKDDTFAEGRRAVQEENLPFPVTVLINPVNQGYGGNQKIGFHYAIENGFDFVALVHGDGQYAPECLPDLIVPLRDGEADAVFGSRMITRGGALKGGMPFYKYVGNKILSTMQNRLLRSDLSEFHSGYRLYSTKALAKIPFDLNSNVFHFDTEIIIQLLVAGKRIVERPIPTYYGDEVCNVDGLRYAWDVTKATFRARFQEYGLLYDRKFDCAPTDGHSQYLPKTDFPSPHTEAVARIPEGSRVLDLGGASGFLGRALKEKGCTVTGIDLFPPSDAGAYDAFHQHDLNDPNLPVSLADFDVIVMLDVIEHLARPEAFVEALRNNIELSKDTRIIVSTGNVAFGITRLGLTFGLFNYGKRGILDMTHSRLFTFATIIDLFEQANFLVDDVKGIPAPFPLALGAESKIGRALPRINQALIHVSRGFFAYQSFLEVRKVPDLPQLLAETISASEDRAKSRAE